MSSGYKVQVTSQAQAHLREIVHYIAVDLNAPSAAERILDVLEEAISSLAQFPNRIALTEEEPWHSQGIHKMAVDHYLV